MPVKLPIGYRNNRRIGAALAVTLVCGVVISFAAMLALCYKFGVRELQTGLGHPHDRIGI